jgi:hypothetical protein
MPTRNEICQDSELLHPWTAPIIALLACFRVLNVPRAGGAAIRSASAIRSDQISLISFHHCFSLSGDRGPRPHPR